MDIRNGKHNVISDVLKSCGFHNTKHAVAHICRINKYFKSKGTKHLLYDDYFDAYLRRRMRSAMAFGRVMKKKYNITISHINTISRFTKVATSYSKYL